MKKLIFLILGLFYSLTMAAQSPETVRVNVIAPPPHTDRLSYYGEPGRMIVTITNLTNQAQDVYLRGSIKGTDNDRYIYTDPNFRPDNSYTISIPAGIGQTVNVPSRFIQDVYYTDNIIYTGTSAEAIKRAGRLGEGCYSVCMSAWNIRNHTQRLSSEQTGCTMICIRNIEAPILIKPLEEEVIKPIGIQNVIFSWNRPAGTTANVRYKLKIVEMFDHARNPNDAFLSATTPPFFEEEIMTNAFVYGPSAPPLVEGRKYAWSVTAFDPTGSATFQNGGRSEVRAFIFGNSRLSAPAIISPEHNSNIAQNQSINFRWSPVTSSSNIKYHFKISEISSLSGTSKNPTIADAVKALNSQSQPVFETTINENNLMYNQNHPPLVFGKQYAVQVSASDPLGRIQFENDGKSTPVIFRYGELEKAIVRKKTDTLNTITTHVTGKLFYHFKDDTQGRTFPISNERVFLRRVLAQRSVDSNGIEHYTAVPNLNTSGQSTMLDGVSVETDVNGNFKLTCQMSSLDSAGIISQSNWGAYVNENRNPYRGNVAVMYRLETTNPHYKATKEYIKLTPGGTLDLTNIVLEANSYTLAINVQEIFNQLKGNFVANAKLKIYRDANSKNDPKYGIPKFEGDLLTENLLSSAQKADKILIAERATPAPADPTKPAGSYVYFKHLFRATSAEPYRYRIVLEDGSKVITELSYSQLTNALSLATAKDQSVSILNQLQITEKPQTISPTALNNIDKSGLSKLLSNETSDVKTVVSPTKSNVKANVASLPQSKNLESRLPQQKDKWLNYYYASKPDTAWLTVNKELVSPPRSKVTGKLQYNYKNQKNIPAAPYANMPVKLMVVYLTDDKKSNVSSAGGSSIVNATGFYQTQISNYANQNLVASYSGLVTNMSNYKPSTNAGSLLYVGSKRVEDNYKVLQTVYTDSQGNFEFDFPASELTGQAQDGTWSNAIAGSSNTMKDVRIKRVYRIVPDVKYYCAPDNDVIVQPWGQKDVGTLTSYVQTFNLKVQVQKIDKEYLPSTPKPEDGFNNVPVNLYRAASSPSNKYLPAALGTDLNQRVQLFDLPSSNNSSSSSGSSNKNNSTTASNQPVFTAHFGQTYSNQFVTSASTNGTNPSNSVGAYRVSNLSSTLTGVALPMQQLQNTYIKYREGMSSGNGEIVFRNVVKSMGKEDVILLEADNIDRLASGNFSKAYLEFPKTTNILTAQEDVKNREQSISGVQLGTDIPGIVRADINGPLFNSQFDPEETATAYLRVLPGGTLVRGRVKDRFTNLGVKGVLLNLRVVIDSHLLIQSVTTDDDGFYSFDAIAYWLATLTPERFPLMTGINAKGENTYTELNVTYAPGYEKEATRDLGAFSPGRTGIQIEREITLNPSGRGVYGYVVDQDNINIGVTARVKAEINGRWVDTKAYSGQLNQAIASPNYMESNGMYASTLESAIQKNIQQATSSTSKKASTSVGSLGTINTTIQGGNTQTTFTVFSTKPSNNQHPIVQGALSMSQENNSLKVLGTGLKPNLQNVTDNLATALKMHQRFDMDLPTRPLSLIILPYDPAYLPDTVQVHPKDSYENIGTFKLRKRKHRLNVAVTTKDGKVVQGAQVTIVGAEDLVKFTNSQGIASFEFVNNSISNFTIRINNQPQTYKLNSTNIQSPGLSLRPEPNLLIVPKTIDNVHSEDDLVLRTEKVTVEKAIEVKGKVIFEKNNQPVANALVFVDQGKGSDSDIRAVTKSDGTFSIPLPVSESSRFQNSSGYSQTLTLAGITITTSYAEEGKTYIGSSQRLILEQSKPIPQVSLTIKEVEDIDISKLFGFPARIKALTKTSENSYRISGELHNLTENENFTLSTQADASRVLSFSNLEVKPSALSNSNGTPVAVPVGDKISFINREINIRAFQVFRAIVNSDEGKTLEIVRSKTDTTGILSGQVRIVDNSFNFPTSYMTISNQDFYLGRYGETNVSQKLTIPIFRTDQEYPLTKFSLTTNAGKPIQFKYLGYNGTAEIAGERESFVMGDNIHLFMNLRTSIQGEIPILLKAGKAVIKHDRIEKMVTTEAVNIELDKWKISAKSWELSNSSGGIVLHDNILYTGRADIKLKKITIQPGELIFNNGTKNDNDTRDLKKNLTLGGKANIPLVVYDNTDITFLYDPNVGRIPGRGHFKFSLSNPNGKAAYIHKLPGMTTQSDKITIQSISILSNNEEVFGFEANAPSVTYQNQISFKPGSIYSNFDRLIISGTADLHIPNIPTLTAEFTYLPQNGGGLKLDIKPFAFTFTGNGGTKFKTHTGTGSQIFETKGFGIAGQVSLPGQNTWIETQLLSIVTGAYNQGAEAVRKQSEVIIGHYKEEAKNMAAELVDEVLNSPELKGLRNNIEDRLDQGYKTVNQMLPMGDAGQMLNNLAGKWRLAGQGMNVVNNMVDGNPIGAMMQLNGLIEGALGINVVDEAKNKAKMVAMEVVKGIQDEIPVEALAEKGMGGSGGKPGMQFDFDFVNGRVFGSLSVPMIETGAVNLSKLGMELLFDRQGWYFYTGATVNVRAVPLIFPVAAGMLIGNYNSISPALEARVTEVAYVKKLPATYKTNGIKGFFLVGRKDILEEVKFGVNFVVADFEVGAMAGLDARLYANFGSKSQEIGVGAMLFARAYARLSVLGICGIEGEAKAELGAKATFTNSGGNPSFTAAACASVNLRATVSCLITESVTVGFQALLKLCAGNCNKTVDWSLRYGGGSCSEGNDFDY